MRVLCTSTPMDGVVIPLLPIAHALRDRGHEAMIAAGPDVEARMQECGFSPTAVAPAAMEAALRAFGAPAVGGPGAADPVFAAAMFGGVFAPELLPELRRIADAFVPDAVVHPAVEFASPIL